MATRSPKSTPPAPRFTEDGEGAQMGFFEHLDELRQRFMWGFGVALVATLAASFFAEPVLRYLGEPYLRLTADNRFQILDPTGAVVAYLRVALLMGVTLAVPVLTYHILMFFLPALDKRQRRFVLASLPAVFILFLLGVTFTWFIMIPPALTFLAGFAPNLFRAEWEASSYINFVTSLLFWMGVAFETPLVLFVLSLLGIVAPTPLIRSWRLAIVVTAVIAALITPTVDPVNMLLVMGPLLVLYVISILLVAVGIRLFRRNHRQEDPRARAVS